MHTNTYADAIATVSRILPGAFLTRTDTADVVIQAPFNNGWLWISDLDNGLPTHRDDLTGWTVALYQDAGYDGTPVDADVSADVSLDSLANLVRTVAYGS
jgi:hypothetical protein